MQLFSYARLHPARVMALPSPSFQLKRPPLRRYKLWKKNAFMLYGTRDTRVIS